jgi:excisionase family DNA binding protein
MTVTDPPRLRLTPEEAAKCLGIGRSTLFKLLASGDLQSVRIGTARRITLSQLEHFVAQLACEGEIAIAPLASRRARIQ